MTYLCAVKKQRIVIVGGGAAGFFAAANMAEMAPENEYVILEQSPNVLGKVKISGGGRCNVTHASFVPRELSKAYPRGEKALLGPFHKFMTGDVMGWFEERGVPLKVEDDGRVFPESDQSQSIIDCLLSVIDKHQVEVRTRHRVEEIIPNEDGPGFEIHTKDGWTDADKVLVATGSNASIWKLMQELGHQVVSPVPSLFTFNIKDLRIDGLAGLTVPEVEVSIPGTKLLEQGPLLVTHWGLSGPAILRLSAWGARALADKDYDFQLKVNWMAGRDANHIMEDIQLRRERDARKRVSGHVQYGLPQRLWRSLVAAAMIGPDVQWANLSKVQAQSLAEQLTSGLYQVKGKSTFKEEFVTAGGVVRKEINFKTMESKVVPGLYFAGEVLDVDAITGGYNFQAAWTGAWLAAQAMIEEDMKRVE